MTTAEIKNTIQIVNVKGKKFTCPGGYTEISKGFAFFVPRLGYLKFESDETFIPYIPVGGKKALQEILKAGGFTSFDEMDWLQELKIEKVGN
jgi:hypothetical protein